MKFPTLSRSKPATAVNDAPPPTAAQKSSQNTSMDENEKVASAMPTRTSSISSKTAQESGDNKVMETTAIKEAEALEKFSDEPEYPTGAKLGIIVASLCLSVFLMALDNTIIATAIPKITDQFKALDDVGWYGSGEPQGQGIES